MEVLHRCLAVWLSSKRLYMHVKECARIIASTVGTGAGRSWQYSRCSEYAVDFLQPLASLERCRDLCGILIGYSICFGVLLRKRAPGGRAFLLL